MKLLMTNDLLRCEGVTATDSCLTFCCQTGVELIQERAAFTETKTSELVTVKLP